MAALLPGLGRTVELILKNVGGIHLVGAVAMAAVIIREQLSG